MISKGSLVKRMPSEHPNSNYLYHCTTESINSYPPENALCVVLRGPRKRDLSNQLNSHNRANVIALYSAVDVLYEGKVYHDCELSVFREVKKNDRGNM